MRPIEFRVWLKERKDFIYVGYIDLVNKECSGLPYDIQEGEDEYLVSTEGLEQFTGVHDKDGTKIYVGDVLQEIAPRGNRYTVFSVEGGFAVNTFQDGDKSFYESLADKQTANYIKTQCIIIGNIHDTRR